jgi:hypothetical protein
LQNYDESQQLYRPKNKKAPDGYPGPRVNKGFSSIRFLPFKESIDRTDLGNVVFISSYCITAVKFLNRSQGGIVYLEVLPDIGRNVIVFIVGISSTEIEGKVPQLV